MNITIFVVNFSSENVLTTTKTKQKLLERNQSVAQEAEEGELVRKRRAEYWRLIRKPRILKYQQILMTMKINLTTFLHSILLAISGWWFFFFVSSL